MDNKYTHLTEDEFCDLFDTYLNFDKKAQQLFIKEMFQEVPDNKLKALWNASISNETWTEYKKEPEIYLNFIKKCFDILPPSVIYNSSDNMDFIIFLSDNLPLLTQYFDIVFKQDKKKNHSEFNSFMTDVVCESELFDTSENFKKIILFYQDFLEASILNEVLIQSKKSVDYFLLFNETSKQKIENEMGLNDFLNHIIASSEKKDNIASILKENNLIDKLKAEQIMCCINHNKKFLINELFTKDKIREEIKLDFFHTLLKNANNSKNNFKFIQKYLTSDEIVNQLKKEIKENASLGNFHKNYYKKYSDFIDSIVNIFTHFDKELGTYFKEKPIKVLENFVVAQEKQIKKAMNDDYDYEKNQSVNERYNTLLIEIQQKLFNDTISNNNQPSKKIKI